MADFFLNKIDPHIVQSVVRINADKVVHAMKDSDIRVDPDKEHEKQEQPEKEKEKDEELSEESISQKVLELNHLSDKKHLNFYFSYDKTNKELCVKVLEKGTKRHIRSLKEAAVKEMLEKLSEAAGVLLDDKG